MLHQISIMINSHEILEKMKKTICFFPKEYGDIDSK